MTTVFFLYFVPMLLWYICVGLILCKDWYEGEDIPLSDILLGIVIGLVPLLNLISFVAVCCALCDDYVRHFKIKGRKQ